MPRCPTCHRRLGSAGCAVHGGAAAPETRAGLAPPPWREPIVAAIGAGGFASVWELAGARVLKLAHAATELARARIAREAEALRAIGVPRLDDSGVLDDGRGWLVIEKLPGASVADVLAAGPVKLADALAIAAAAAEALQRVHAARFVHRDVKPDNLIGGVLIDLGLARRLPEDPDDPTRAHVQVGSLEYIAPEQLADASRVDERADIYALGCVIYELLAGRPPFVGDAAALERAHAALRPPRLSALASVPSGIEALVHECLAKEPAGRPATAAEVRARLRAGAEDSSARGHSMSVIREGKQPVVIMWAELPKIDRALLGVVSARRMVVASQRGRRVLAAVLGGDHADPAAVALGAARELAAAGARVALHLAALRVGAAALEGEAVERPESWLPSGAWSGAIVTRAFAAVAQTATRASSLGEEFRELAGDAEGGELFGRDALVSDLVADAAAALGGVGPAFAIAVGDAGVGKTALARELARRLQRLTVGAEARAVRVHVEAVPPPGAGKRPFGELGEWSGVRAIGDALRGAARIQPLAIVLDDLQHADADVLDALEYATLGGEPLPLWILGVASPRLDARRPELGRRAERHRRDVIAPLEEDAAVAFAAALLRPAEYPPLRALRRLVAIARGNPLHLSMLAREIHERGAIRERGGGGHYLDTSALDELSPVALGPWLAARELAGLPAEVVALARVCAVLGEVAFDELAAIVEAVERRGGATTTIDAGVGLAELARAGILAITARGYAFRQALVEEGVYATTDERERLAVHVAALDYACASGDPERVARHAEAADAHALAAAAFDELGERAWRDHRPLDADQAWSGALRHLPDRDRDRARALIGRGRARGRLQRMNEALADFAEAAAIARELADGRLEARALIEQATVLDFIEGVAGEVTRANAALARAREVAGGDADLLLDLDLAAGRSAFRTHDNDTAATTLRHVLAAARARGRHDTATIAALLLGPILCGRNELDEAERVFGELITDLRARGDRFHLAAALGNRTWLYSARGQIDRMRDDLRDTIQLARESGQAHFERVATYNLCEDRLWNGALDEALPLARRSFALQSRAGEGGTRVDRMLLARVLAARGDRDELARVLATFADEPAGDDALELALLHAAVDPARWDAALAGLAGAPRPELYAVSLRLEMLHLVQRHGRLTEELREEARRLAVADPFWSHRIGELGA